MFLYDTEQDLTNVLDVAKVKKWKVTSVAWVPQKDGHFGPNMMNLLGDSLRVPVVVNLEGLEQVSLQVLFAERMKQQVATTLGFENIRSWYFCVTVNSVDSYFLY